MSIEDLGFTTSLADYIVKNNLSEFTPGRIMQEHRERYIVSSGEREYDAEITGNMRFSATGREDFPAVGDWVAMAVYEPDMAIIHHILPRKSILSRQAIGKPGEKQIIASNVDAAFILQAVNNNFNINRLERYMAICLSAGIEPVLVLTKTDLLTEAEVKEEEKQVKQRHSGLNIILLDNISGRGLESIALLMKKGKTYCVLGSSGVGKSTLINNLL
ncbi:MAG TPA: GTPase RsgA, partial [Bacteroidales bacterium]|nr:GTPase RsgA [Bacteroidales bacterium]